MTEEKTHPYCVSRFYACRWPTRRVSVGGLGIGGGEPVRVQSMTTTPTQDVVATVKQVLALAQAGCELVRITAQTIAAAKALGDIRKALRQAGCTVPLVADIHFLPQAALEAAKHVDKVRINPGNFADRKKFALREYTDSQYTQELERLYAVFSPLVLRCKQEGCALRIGTNHGSLSDRIMNRYGDTPLGMVASALEFLEIAESHGYYSMILSMKASNPKVMLQAYRLSVAMMHERGMAYPLHLGVTEAGAGEDARIKSAMGIGTLLEEGLGDTIRVSLTEDPLAELPVARLLAQRAMKLWEQTQREHPRERSVFEPLPKDLPTPYAYERREITPLTLAPGMILKSDAVPRVLLPLVHPFEEETLALQALNAEQTPLEGLLFTSQSRVVPAWESAAFLAQAEVSEPELWPKIAHKTMILCLKEHTLKNIAHFELYAQKYPQAVLALDASPTALMPYVAAIKQIKRLIFTLSAPLPGYHGLGSWRLLADWLRQEGIQAPLWLRLTQAFVDGSSDEACLLQASQLAGGLLCEGLGDLISVEFPQRSLQHAHTLSYNLLQGARARSSKTEFVACPSCGRTLFDLQSTTEKIQKHTGHLKGVTIAIMGCIVNGPGEMADAHFGYVGGAPGKINLYKGKTCVEYNIPEAQALEALVGLIKKENMWFEGRIGG